MHVHSANVRSLSQTIPSLRITTASELLLSLPPPGESGSVTMVGTGERGGGGREVEGETEGRQDALPGLERSRAVASRDVIRRCSDVISRQGNSSADGRQATLLLLL